MDNQVEVFNFEANEVRTVVIDQEAWFVGKDVADALGYSKARNALAKHVDEDDALKRGVTDNIGRQQEMTLINESGVYSLIFSSKLDGAKRFKKWVTSEVLPSIRKTGSYSVQPAIPQNFAEALQLAADQEKEKNRLSQQLELQAPKVDYYENVIASDETLSVSQISKDYGMSAKEFNKLLHNLGIQYKVGNQWVLYSGLTDEGYTKATTGTKSNGGTYTTTRWTNKGKEFIYQTLKEQDILTTEDNRLRINNYMESKALSEAK